MFYNLKWNSIYYTHNLVIAKFSTRFNHRRYECAAVRSSHLVNDTTRDFLFLVYFDEQTAYK